MIIMSNQKYVITKIKRKKEKKKGNGIEGNILMFLEWHLKYMDSVLSILAKTCLKDLQKRKRQRE